MNESIISPKGLNPSGICMCGCGGRANLASVSNAKRGDVAGEPYRYIRQHQRRLSAVEYTVDPITGCWLWQRAIANGYGKIMIDGVNVLAHRVMYERANGPVPAGLELDHLCRNRACVNPAHLEPVTRAVNSQRGATAKLTPEQVLSIRKKHADGSTQHSLAAEYGVCQPTISIIVRRKRWKNI